MAVHSVLKVRSVETDQCVSSSNLVADLEVGTGANDYIRRACTQAVRRVVVRIVAEYAAQACALATEHAAQVSDQEKKVAARVDAQA